MSEIEKVDKYAKVVMLTWNLQQEGFYKYGSGTFLNHIIKYGIIDLQLSKRWNASQVGHAVRWIEYLYAPVIEINAEKLKEELCN